MKEVMKFQVNDHEFQLQKYLNCVILLLNLLEFVIKKKCQTWNNGLTKFTQVALIGFVPLIPHFGIFVRTYNWNHYRQIKVNIIWLRFESWFFLAQNVKIWGFGFEIFKNKDFIRNQHLRNRIQPKFKIKKLIPLGPKYLNLGVWAQSFWKRILDLKSPLS